jgi:plastocyanin
MRASGLLRRPHPVSLEDESMRRSGLLALAMAGAFIAASCGGGGGGSTSATPTAPSGGGGGTTGPITITITGQGGKLAFTPNPATVADGQLVMFKNNDTIAHHVMLDDGSSQTPDIAPGATSAPVAIGSNKSYHCTIHPEMVGGFNGTQVEPPPNCTGAYC